MTDLIKAKNKLREGDFTCVLCRGNEMCLSHARGVKPLVSWYEQNVILNGFSAADKVVGKATAFLYVLHGVNSVYANVISRPALDVLKSYGISVEYNELVNNIINRSGDGICPFEAAVKDISDKEMAYLKILDKMAEMNISYL